MLLATVEPQASALLETQVGVDTQPLNLTVVVANYGDPPVPTTNITWSKVSILISKAIANYYSL